MIRFVLCIVAIMSAIPAAADIKIQKVTSAKGITAWLVNEPSIPFVAFDMLFRGGASLDNVEKHGATYLMAALLEEGTGDMDASDFSRATEELAANFSFEAGRDTVHIKAEVLKSNVDEALALLSRAIAKPAFNQDAVDRVRQQVLSGIRSDETDPDEIAAKILREAAFTKGHPYARSLQGGVESVTALTPDDLRAAHQGALALDRVFIGVVGDVTAPELAVMLDNLLGDLPQTGAAFPEKSDFMAAGGTTVVDFKSPQSKTVWAQRGIARDDPDFFALYVMNRILGGGGFSSRLTEEVREKRGLTYGIYSYIASAEFGDFFGGSVASGNDTMADAIDIIKSEWTRLANDGVTDQELTAAKTYLTGAYPLRFDGNGNIASILTGMQLQDLGLDYIKTRNDRVNAITQDDIARVAKRVLDPDNLRFVVVGQPIGLDVTR